MWSKMKAGAQGPSQGGGKNSAEPGSETLAPATGAGSPASSSDSSPPPTAQFAGDTISAARDAGDMETPEDEVAAFVQRRGDS